MLLYFVFTDGVPIITPNITAPPAPGTPGAAIPGAAGALAALQGGGAPGAAALAALQGGGAPGAGALAALQGGGAPGAGGAAGALAALQGGGATDGVSLLTRLAIANPDLLRLIITARAQNMIIQAMQAKPPKGGQAPAAPAQQPDLITLTKTLRSNPILLSMFLANKTPSEGQMALLAMLQNNPGLLSALAQGGAGGAAGGGILAALQSNPGLLAMLAQGGGASAGAGGTGAAQCRPERAGSDRLAGQSGPPPAGVAAQFV